MKLNGKNYDLPQKVTFGYVYKKNEVLKKNGTNFILLLSSFGDNDMLFAFPNIVAMMMETSVENALNEIDRAVDAGEKYEDIMVGAIEAFQVISENAVFEGFIKAMAKLEEKAKKQEAKTSKTK